MKLADDRSRSGRADDGPPRGALPDRDVEGAVGVGDIRRKIKFVRQHHWITIVRWIQGHTSGEAGITPEIGRCIGIDRSKPRGTRAEGQMLDNSTTTTFPMSSTATSTAVVSSVISSVWRPVAGSTRTILAAPDPKARTSPK